MNTSHKIRLLLLLAAAALCCANPAYAHKMKIFATTDGETISGYAYLSGGGRIQKTTVNAFDPADMSSITNVVTDAEGRFSFGIASKHDHLLRIDLGDGHMAEWLVKSEEPPAASQPTGTAPESDAVGNEHILPLQHQISMLQEQLEAYEEKVRLHDILGGIGYILGLAGIAFYFMGKKRNRS